MSEGLKAKSHLGTNSVAFGPIHELSFDNVASVAGSVALTTVQARIPLPQDIQILKAAVSASAVTGEPAIQVVYGTGTPGSVAASPSAPDQGNPIAPVTTIVFNAPVCVAAANTPLGIAPAVPEAIFQQSSPGTNPGGAGAGELTLRALTGSGDAATNLKVVLLVRDVDPLPNIPGTVPFTDW